MLSVLLFQITRAVQTIDQLEPSAVCAVLSDYQGCAEHLIEAGSKCLSVLCRIAAGQRLECMHYPTMPAPGLAYLGQGGQHPILATGPAYLRGR